MMLAVVAWGAERNEKLLLPEGMTILKDLFHGHQVANFPTHSSDVTLLDISYFLDPRVAGFSVQSFIGTLTPFSIGEAVLAYFLGFVE